MIKDFKPHTLETNTQVMANMLPPGELYVAKNIDGSKLRKMLIALAYELGRAQGKIYELSQEHNLETTKELIEEWERALGIPDDCFININIPIADRQKQIIAKFAKMNLVTEKDWIDLAAFLGHAIQIIHPTTDSHFDYIFPFEFDDELTDKFIMIIKFLDIDEPVDVFPCEFDFTFGISIPLMCIFEHLKPANVLLIYKFRDSP